MRYTYKKKQKFYQLNTITSLNIHSNKPNLRKYPSILALFSKIYNFTNQRFPQQYIKNISRAVFDKQSQTIDRQVKIFEVPKLRNESSFQLSLRILSRVFREHVQRPLERILALELGPQIGTTKDDRSQLLSGLKISEMIADLFFHQISLGLPSATQNANYFLLQFFFRLMSSIQLLSSLF